MSWPVLGIAPCPWTVFDESTLGDIMPTFAAPAGPASSVVAVESAFMFVDRVAKTGHASRRRPKYLRKLVKPPIKKVAALLNAD